MKLLHKVLTYLSLTDGPTLSLTSVALLVVVVKVALAPQASLVDLGALLLSLANYAHRRYTRQKTTPPVDLSPVRTALAALTQATTTIDTLTRDVSTLKSAIALKSTR